LAASTKAISSGDGPW